MEKLLLRRQYGQAIHVRHTSSVCRAVEWHSTKRQTEVGRTLTQTIALLVFMAASVLPNYGQEVKTSQIPQPSQSPSEPTSQTSQTAAKQTTSKPFVFPTKRERFNRYAKSTVGPFSLFHDAMSAGINQWRDNPEEWEQGASGYGKRFASAFGKTAIQQTVIYGLDSAMGLDTGFKRSQRKGFFPRMTDALAANVTSRTRSGKRVVSVPKLAGVYTSAIISHEAWYPPRYNYKDGLRSGTKSLLTGFGLNLVKEFIIRF